MKKFIGILMIAMLLIAFVSCSNEVGTTNTTSDKAVDLKLAIKIDGEDKALDYSSHYAAGFAIASYEYKATCTTTANAQGTQASWATLTVSEGSATLSKLARGTWTIDVRAKNSTGGVISQAQVAGVVLQTNGQTQTINLKNTNGTTSATVSIGVTAPTLAQGTLEVKYQTLANIATIGSGTSVTMTPAAGKVSELSGSGIIATTASAGNTAYTGSVSLAPGLYVMQVLYKDNGTTVAGQMMAFRVADNTPFAINGTLTAGEFLDLELSSITTDERIIAVTVTNAATVTAGTLACTVSATGADSLNYTWCLDGSVVAGQTSASYSNAFSSTGTHVLSCIVTGTKNGETVIGYAQSTFTVN